MQDFLTGLVPIEKCHVRVNIPVRQNTVYKVATLLFVSIKMLACIMFFS